MSFILTRPKGQHMPRVVERPVATGGAWLLGALLIENGTGEFAEAGADPAAVGAVALSGAGADNSGFNRLATKGFPPGYCQGVAVADEDAQFHAQYVGVLPSAPGGSYGVVKDADGKWKVDFGETLAPVVKLVSLKWTEAPLNQNRVVVKFLRSKVQELG